MARRFDSIAFSPGATSSATSRALKGGRVSNLTLHIFAVTLCIVAGVQEATAACAGPAMPSCTDWYLAGNQTSGLYCVKPLGQGLRTRRSQIFDRAGGQNNRDAWRQSRCSGIGAEASRFSDTIDATEHVHSKVLLRLSLILCPTDNANSFLGQVEKTALGVWSWCIALPGCFCSILFVKKNVLDARGRIARLVPKKNVRAIFLMAMLLHSVVLVRSDSVLAVGYNNNGQLGDGTTVDRSTAVNVVGLTDCTAIAVGNGHSLFLLGTGTVKAVGYNSNGQLGDGTTVDKSTAVNVVGVTDCIVNRGLWATRWKLALHRRLPT